MSLLENALLTYDMLQSLYAGVYEEGKQPLAPIGHIIGNSSFCFTVSPEGELSGIEPYKEQIILPATEKSANRTGGDNPHALHEQIGYLSQYEKSWGRRRRVYLDHLAAWIGWLRNNRDIWSSVINEKTNGKLSKETIAQDQEIVLTQLDAVYKYVTNHDPYDDLRKAGLADIKEGGNEEKQLEEIGKSLVAWKVPYPHAQEACWRSKAIMTAYEAYFLRGMERKNKKRKTVENAFCMFANGETAPGIAAPETFHLRGIDRLHFKGKLISANDECTYRGRFANVDQALPRVGLEASQKIDNILKWLIANNGIMLGSGCRTTGTKSYDGTFVCWGIPTNKAEIDDLTEMSAPDIGASVEDFLEIDESDVSNDFTGSEKEIANKLVRRLGSHALYDTWSHMNVVVLQIANPVEGRLAITYYSEMRATDVLEKMAAWDARYHWDYKDPKRGNYVTSYPSIDKIATYAIGISKDKNGYGTVEIGDKQQALYCRLYRQLLQNRLTNLVFPEEIKRMLVQKAARLASYGSDTRETLLTIVCSVIPHDISEMKKGKTEMGTEEKRRRISYLYGQLLAVYDAIEKSAEKKSNTGYKTRALLMQPSFCQSPYRVAAMLETHMSRAYYSKLSPTLLQKYRELISDIIADLAAVDGEESTLLSKPLKDDYLIGYYLQRKKLDEYFQKYWESCKDRNSDANSEEESHE